MSNATQTTASQLNDMLGTIAQGDSNDNVIAQVAGATAIGAAVGILATAITTIVSCTLIGFWMTVLLALLSWIIGLIMYFLVPTIMDNISDESYASIGRSVGGLASKVQGWFTSDKAAAEPATAAI